MNEVDLAGDIPFDPYDEGRSRHIGTWVAVVLVLAVLIAVLVLVALPARRDVQKYDDARSVYLSGDCATALEQIEGLVTSFRLADITRRVADAKKLRRECQEFLDIADLGAEDPAAALLAYLDIVRDDPPSALRDAAATAGRGLADSTPPKDLAAVDTCSALVTLRDNGIVPPGQVGELRGVCIGVLDDADRTDAAVDLAVRVLDEHGDEPAAAIAAEFLVANEEGCAEIADQADAEAITPAIRATCLGMLQSEGENGAAYDLALAILKYGDDAGASQAATIVVNAQQACFEIESLLALKGLTSRATNLKALLIRCVDEATEAGDADLVASLRFEFITRLRVDPDAGLARLAFVTEVASCGLADKVEADPSLRIDNPFLTEYYFTCGQFGAYLAGWDLAVRMYEGFLRVAPADQRVPVVQTGLAKSLVAAAKLLDPAPAPLPAPLPAGNTDARRADVVVYNMSPHEVRVAAHGLEASALQVIPACFSCVDYDLAGPTECRTDVPSTILSLTPGDYDVLISSTEEDADPSLGLWSLARGNTYQTCYFVVKPPG